MLAPYVSLFLFLSLAWWVLSGMPQPLMLALGLLSVFLTLLISFRLRLVDWESHPVHLLNRLPGFWLRLFTRIVLANIDVLLRILGLRAIDPAVLKLPLPYRKDLSKAAYANAITLTPGTASIELTQRYLRVHALSASHSKELVQGQIARLVGNLNRESE
ncbi:Na+/H+ antiporter subunit E [Bowmanella dokdonensis]|uniref:Na+/H+ antiporter subunit E n=1 Tax=Bowmanella dokdonensis TaxID=751969 RepID=A0A939IR14_9ALTE|nr:Na+/H+ antiporter subunit E [Bowmanella dokdonensis]MBN7825016.1 Na+/H+ antiporter subunit E [Bowmanella dokdonensis]